MHDKSKQPVLKNQPLPAGVGLTDHNIEFVGNKTNKTVIWLRTGNTHTFETLPTEIFQALQELMETDQAAIKILKIWHPEAVGNTNRMVELYTYYMYGDLDNTPDIINGKVQPSENFRDSQMCISLAFKNKTIDVDGIELNQRDLLIIDSISEGKPDKAIAQELCIKIPTLDFHKRQLFKKLKANGRAQAITNAFKNHIISSWDTEQ